MPTQIGAAWGVVLMLASWVDSSTVALLTVSIRADPSAVSRQKATRPSRGATTGLITSCAIRRMKMPRGLISQRSITSDWPEAAGEVDGVAGADRGRVATICPSPVQAATPKLPGSARRLSPRKVRLALAKEATETGGGGDGAVTNRTTTGLDEGRGGAGATVALGRGAATGAGFSWTV